MKPTIPFTVAMAALFISTAAIASDEFVADCEEFKAANGVDGDCECMAAAVEGNQELADEIMGTETLDDIDDLSAEAKEVIESC